MAAFYGRRLRSHLLVLLVRLVHVERDIEDRAEEQDDEGKATMRWQFLVPVLVVGSLLLLYCAFTMAITWGEGHLIQPIIAVAFTGTALAMTFAWRTRTKKAKRR